MRTLDKWARQVESETLRNHHRFLEAPENYENSEAFFRMLMLVTVLQQDFGVRYNPDRIREIDFRDSSDLFIHGMIGTERVGHASRCRCSTSPLDVDWAIRCISLMPSSTFFADGKAQTESLNIEATSRGLITHKDDFYMSWPKRIDPDEVEAGQYLSSLTMAESFAAFFSRARPLP